MTQPLATRKVGTRMRRIIFLVVSVVAVGGAIASIVPPLGHAAGEADPVWVTKIPPGYRDWKLISVAHEEGNLNSFAAVLGNDTTIKAYRDGTLPFPDGSIIGALHFRHVPSEENNKVFGQAQSFVPGEPTNVQFMVKDSTKYSATGGWGYGHFNASDGKPGNEALMTTCFPCHAEAKGSDQVFTHYAR